MEKRSSTNKLAFIIIAVGLCVIAGAVFFNLDYFKQLAAGQPKEGSYEFVTQQLEAIKKSIDPNNKEQMDALRAEVKGYVDLAKEDKTDYSTYTPEEFIIAELKLLTEISGQITNALDNYKLKENPSTFMRMHDQFMRNAVTWGRMIKFRDELENNTEYNAARTKHADDIRKVLNDLGQNQGKMQAYADGQLNSLMFRRILDEVSERGKFSKQPVTEKKMKNSEISLKNLERNESEGDAVN